MQIAHKLYDEMPRPLFFKRCFFHAEGKKKKKRLDVMLEHNIKMNFISIQTPKIRFYKVNDRLVPSLKAFNYAYMERENMLVIRLCFNV
jgi:hypothetical protein